MGMQAITGATVIDGTGGPPIENGVVLLAGDRIAEVRPLGDGALPGEVSVVDARGKFVIPGLLDANVHLCPMAPELVIRFDQAYEPLVVEAAQLTLRNGVTTVFDTWGALQPLKSVQRRISDREIVGSRIFLAGNIIGLDGPLSADFTSVPERFLPKRYLDRINDQWENGTGSQLRALSVEDLRDRVREYIAVSEVDFVKYAGSGHAHGELSLLCFSLDGQRAIVEESHRAGLKVQAHTTSVESLRMEVQAGVDLLQHPDLTGPIPIPSEVVQQIAVSKVPGAVLLWTDAAIEWSERNNPRRGVEARVSADNARHLIEAGAVLLLTSDGTVFSEAVLDDPATKANFIGMPAIPVELGQGHFHWLEAAAQRGMKPMEILKSATRNVAEAYGVEDLLGTLEPGKLADLLILDADPLESAENYRSLVQVVKGGYFVDRDALPAKPDARILDTRSA